MKNEVALTELSPKLRSASAFYYTSDTFGLKNSTHVELSSYSFLYNLIALHGICPRSRMNCNKSEHTHFSTIKYF